MLRKDKEEVEAIKHAKALEAEKAMYSVRYYLFPGICQENDVRTFRNDVFVCFRGGVLADKGESSERRGLKADRSAHQGEFMLSLWSIPLIFLKTCSTYGLIFLYFSYARRDSPTYDPYKRSVSYFVSISIL